MFRIGHAVDCALLLSPLTQLEAWDERTGVLTGAKERTAALQQKVVSALSKAAENERVQSVVQNVSTGVSSGWWVATGNQNLPAAAQQVLTTHIQHLTAGASYGICWLTLFFQLLPLCVFLEMA
jgi:hypothetical protein